MGINLAALVLAHNGKSSSSSFRISFFVHFTPQRSNRHRPAPNRTPCGLLNLHAEDVQVRPEETEANNERLSGYCEEAAFLVNVFISPGLCCWLDLLIQGPHKGSSKVNRNLTSEEGKNGQQ